MSHATLTPGHRVVVSSFAESPLEAIETSLSIEPMAPPDPATLGARDVIVAVRSAAVGWVDLLMTSGQYQHMPHPPYTPGLESAGEIVWVGHEVGDALAVGDRVLVDGFLAGPRSLGAYQAYGGFATYVVAPVLAARKIPGSLSFDQAAALLGSYETAYHCLVTRGRLQAGETALIHGASGATGLAAVQVAKILGAKVIATGRSDAKLAVVKEQGADHVINCRGEAGAVRPFRDEVKALTGGRGVDVVYDAVGGDISLEPALRQLRRALSHRRLGVDTVRRPRQGPARRAEREPGTDEPDHDEEPRRARVPHGHLHRERSVEPRASPRAGARVGRERPDPPARVAHVPARGVQGGDAREVERRDHRWLRAPPVIRFTTMSP